MARLILRRKMGAAAPPEAPLQPVEARIQPSVPARYGLNWETAYRSYMTAPQELRDDMTVRDYADTWHRVMDGFLRGTGTTPREPGHNYLGEECECPVCLDYMRRHIAPSTGRRHSAGGWTPRPQPEQTEDKPDRIRSFVAEYAPSVAIVALLALGAYLYVNF